MLNEKIINQKAEDLFQKGLVDYIETTENEYQKAISLLEEELNTISKQDDKIKLIDRIALDLRHYKLEHQEECTVEEGEICYFELHYDEVLSFLKSEKDNLTKKPETNKSHPIMIKSNTSATRVWQRNIFIVALITSLIALIRLVLYLIER